MEDEHDRTTRILTVISGGLAYLTAFALILSAASWVVERFVS